jgi:hypothetical protein
MSKFMKLHPATPLYVANPVLMRVRLRIGTVEYPRDCRLNPTNVIRICTRLSSCSSAPSPYSVCQPVNSSCAYPCSDGRPFKVNKLEYAAGFCAMPLRRQLLADECIPLFGPHDDAVRGVGDYRQPACRQFICRDQARESWCGLINKTSFLGRQPPALLR